MTPSQYYQLQVQKGVIQEDQQQLDVLASLDNIFQGLCREYKMRQGVCRLFHRPALVKGLYLWGGIGVGKTFLMDCFYHSLPFESKMRLHFHHFMSRIHTELKNHQGETDPLYKIAKSLSKEILILCFDEFYVSDITDAMLLGRLFEALFVHGVTLVLTSNLAPDDLYKYGLQRQQFMPAIKLIKENTKVTHIQAKYDYRLRHLQEAGVFFSPLDEIATAKMHKTFMILTDNKPVSYDPITVNGRKIIIVKQVGDVVWFDFSEICRIPRSQQDYLVLATLYRIIFISNIPRIPENALDTLRLFVNLVDVCYDARVKLVISAAEPLSELYSRGQMALEYARTHSRLLEMQSIDYFREDPSHGSDF